MSILYEIDSPALPYWQQQAYALGFAKAAGDMTPSYDMSGTLYVSEACGKPWGLLSVPNALVRGIFDALSTPGVELPFNKAGYLDGHISVLRSEEIELIGGPDALKNDRGKSFRYSLGRLMQLEPDGWPGVKTVYACLVHSPELQMLRRSYGLSSLPKYPFHITIAIVKRGVLARNETSKNTAAA